MNASYMGSKTFENLLKAFTMESEARTKYSIYASKAAKEGYEQIAGIFRKISENEMEHAKIWYKELSGSPSTFDNLLAAEDRENQEWSEIYIEFADTASREGFKDIADKFRKIAFIEMNHEDIINKLLNNLDNHSVFRKEKPCTWVCRNCGYNYVSNEAPETCPACEHPQGFFEMKENNF